MNRRHFFASVGAGLATPMLDAAAQENPTSKTAIPANGGKTVWETIADPGGNGGVMFTSIHPLSGHIFTGSDMSRSLFRSTDGAETWEPIGNPVGGTPSYVAPDPTAAGTVFMSQSGVTAEGSGIWKSTDNGDTWKQVCQSGQFGKNVSGVVDPDDPKILYWTVGDRGALRSQDGGASWHDWSNGLPKDRIKHVYGFAHKLKLDINSRPAQRRLFYPTNLGLYQASAPDGGWKPAPGLPAETCTDVNVCGNGVIYAAFPSVGLFISRDDGASWTRSSGLQGSKPGRVVATSGRPEIVYVATGGDIGNAIYGSRDSGRTFRLLTDARFHEGMNWPIDYRQEEGVQARELVIDPRDPMTVYVVRGMKSTDGGKTWRKFGMKEVRQDRWQGTLPLLTQYRVAFDPHRENLIWLGYSDTGLMLSEDGGKTVVAPTNFHRGEANQTAYWRDKLVRSSGSCVSIAVDPDRPTTVYGSVSGKTMESRAGGGGMLIKTVDSGWNWTPIYEKNGLADGIVRSILIDPSSPVENRTVYVASFGNGVYKSSNDGRTFRNTTPANLFNGNTRVMSLAMSESEPQTLYLGVGGSNGIRPIYFAGAGGYPAIQPGMYGGVFRSTDGGNSWVKCNRSRELPSVQEVAVDPTNSEVVYAALYSEDHLVPESGNADWRKGGVYKSTDGGETWERVFTSPSEADRGKGEVQGICINPVAPEIVYAVVENYGVYGSYDSGKTWKPVGEASMERMQRRYHSIALNPHDPSEIWVAHFGTAFSKGIDYHARAILRDKFQHANFLRDPGFEETARAGFGKYWQVEQPPLLPNEKPVVSSSDHAKGSGASIRFHLTAGYTNAPSTIPGQREQRRLEEAGILPADKARKVPGETASWVYQKIHPYFTGLMKGRKVAVEADVFIVEGATSRPYVYLSEARDYNVHWVVAQTYLEDLTHAPGRPMGEMRGAWYRVRSTGTVSQGTHWLEVIISGVGEGSPPMDAYVDNVRLALAE
jgi:photosystem II stability/assembly factor-like uncharacterized protein